MTDLSGTPVIVRLAKSSDEDSWDRFVDAHENGSFFHLFKWQHIFRDIFALEPLYLLAERGDQIVGILPLVHQKSLLFGRALISSPFCVLGGPLGADADVLNALDKNAQNKARELGVSSLEYRTRIAERHEWFAKRGLYATFERALAGDDESNLKLIPRKQRAVVRKALSSNLVSSVGKDAKSFYRVYSESMRNLGTPMFPRRYFDMLLETFPDSDITIIRDGADPVSAVLNFYYRNTVMPYYGGGTTAARTNGANDLLYWEVMRSATARKIGRFDFGRSKAATGAFAFKKNWGFEPQWLEYEYWLPMGGKIPEKNPTNPVYARFSAAWKRLPLPLANFLGPYLIRGLG